MTEIDKNRESCNCGCGHEHHHDEECGCGHEHHHDEKCGCGHEHHHHEHDEKCCCGHHHDHEEHHEHHHDHGHHKHHHEPDFTSVSAGVEQRVYILENLGCANCAAKMEKKIQELPGVKMASITFATKQLRVAADHQEELLPKFQEICSSIESEVTVTPREEVKAERKTGENHVGKRGFFAENKSDLLPIIGGAVLFAAGVIMKQTGVETIYFRIVFLIAYLALGQEIVRTAFSNLLKGRVFDENFLMSIATLAALAIGDFAEAVGVMLFYRVGEFFEHVAVERSRSQIMDAVDMRPEVVNRMNGEEVQVIPAEQACVGDILLIRPGDRIPLDGVVIDGESRLDTSPVTGEPVPVAVKEGTEILSGCVNGQGLLKMRVMKPLGESMVTRILNSVENAAAGKPKLDRFITRFARVYTPVVVLAAVATAIIPSLITGDWKHWIYTAITFLVISCPCALVLSVPLAFFSGIGAGSRQGILFKGGVAMEALKDVKAVVVDKTGTITKGEFRVQSIVPYQNQEMNDILKMAAQCELGSTHPIGNSIVDAARERKISLIRPEEVEEISGKGIRAVCEGKEILCGNQTLLKERGVDIDGYHNEQYGTEVLVAVEGRFAGYLVIADTVKEDAKESIRVMKQHHLVTAMLTGDAQNSAQEVARITGIDEVYAKLLPEEKLSKLQDIRSRHGAVLFVGDGINDAPVLAGADVGAAMGSGADAAIEAADVVFMNSSVSAISQAIEIARTTGRIAMQNVAGALTVKALVMILGFLGFANMWMAVFADTGVAMLCVMNSIRVLATGRKKD